MQAEAGKRQKTAEAEVTRVTLEIKSTSRELDELKAKLQRMSDEGASLDSLERQYQLLSLEFKAKSEGLKLQQAESAKLEAEFQGLNSLIEPQKQVFTDRLTIMKARLDQALATNEKRAIDLKQTHDSLEVAQEVEIKGNKGKEELARVHAWKAKKDELCEKEAIRIEETEKARREKEKVVKEEEERAKSLKDELLKKSILG